MKDKKRKEYYWRRLDDQARIFTLASSKKYSSIFRLSIVLEEKIEEELLKKALDLALKKYMVFKVKMRRGIFWHYFEENPKEPIVSIENDYPFKKVNTKENNDYLFKVTYFDNKINIDFFHALTDGSGGSDFLKEITYRYLELKYPNEIDKNEVEDCPIINAENSYNTNYKKHTVRRVFYKRAYRIRGKRLSGGRIKINHFNIKLKQFLNVSKQSDCTLSMYAIAMIAYCIYDTKYRINIGRKHINISVPINLKKYFASDTTSNFFSYIVVNLKLKRFKKYSFYDILGMVKNEFKKKLKAEKILETLSTDVSLVHNPLVRVVPLFLKKFFVRCGSLEVKRHFTMNVSNIGKFEVEQQYIKYIKKFFVVLSPDWAERIKCGICSYNDNLVVTFATTLEDNLIQNKFKDLLKENNINFYMEGNDINVISK